MPPLNAQSAFASAAVLRGGAVRIVNVGAADRATAHRASRGASRLELARAAGLGVVFGSRTRRSYTCCPIRADRIAYVPRAAVPGGPSVVPFPSAPPLPPSMACQFAAEVDAADQRERAGRTHFHRISWDPSAIRRAPPRVSDKPVAPPDGRLRPGRGAPRQRSCDQDGARGLRTTSATLLRRQTGEARAAATADDDHLRGQRSRSLDDHLRGLAVDPFAVRQAVLLARALEGRAAELRVRRRSNVASTPTV